MLISPPRRNLNGAFRLIALLALIVTAFGVINLARQIVRSSGSTDGGSQSAASGEIIIAPGAEPNEAELEAANYLADKGHKVRFLPRKPNVAEPQPDAQLDDDDFPTEIKTVGNISSDNVPARLAGRIREGLSQAPSVFIDARKQVGLTPEQITEAMRRAIGMARDANRKVRRIHIVGPNNAEEIWDYPEVSTSSSVNTWASYR